MASPPPPSRGAALVVQTSFLGDVVLTTPLLDALAARGPVDVVVTPAAAPLLANHPAVRRCVVYDKRGRDAGPAGLVRTARRIRRHAEPPTTAYLAQGSVRSAALALLAGCGTRVGYESAPGRLLYTHRVPAAAERHHAARLLSLAGVATGDGAPPRVHLSPGPGDIARVEELLEDRAGDPFIALAPGSVWATKRWPYFAELAQRLVTQVPVVIIGGEGDREEAAAVRRAAATIPGAHWIIDATGRLPLLATAEMISRAALIITNDSLPQHLASAAGTPTLTLFGPTVPAFGFGPLAPESAALGVDGLPCRPCHHHGPPECPLGHWRCMRELAVGTVAGAALHHLSRARTGSS